MFNACRRGPASLCRVARLAASSVVPVSRTSILSSASINISKPAIAARFFHISPSIRYFDTGVEAVVDPKDEIVPVSNPEIQIITKFQDLADRGHVHHNVITEITKTMGHHTMTEVQALTIDETLKGTDVYVSQHLRREENSQDNC